MGMAQLPELITIGPVARAFNASPVTVRRWARDGKLDAVELPSGHLRFRRTDVEAILGRELTADECRPQRRAADDEPAKAAS